MKETTSKVRRSVKRSMNFLDSTPTLILLLSCALKSTCGMKCGNVGEEEEGEEGGGVAEGCGVAKVEEEVVVMEEGKPSLDV